MTYDAAPEAAPEIVKLVQKYNFNAALLSMKNTHHNQTPEPVITSSPLFS